MKYAIIDQTATDWFEEVFDSEKEAVESADTEWKRMSEHDKNRREAFFVASCEVEDGGVLFETLEMVRRYK